MSTDLGRIGERARKEPGVIFTTLYHHVTDVDNLRACYDALPEKRAVGVDGVTNYYTITDNAAQCDRFVYYATRLLFKWLNRKSQRKAYTWAGFNHALEHVGWPKARIRIDPEYL